jgi:hypothetical protein
VDQWKVYLFEIIFSNFDIWCALCWYTIICKLNLSVLNSRTYIFPVTKKKKKKKEKKEKKKKNNIAESTKVCYITHLLCCHFVNHMVIALNINRYQATDLQWTAIFSMKELVVIASVLRNWG